MFENFSLFNDSLPGTNLHPYLCVSLFIFYILSYLLSKTMGGISGCLMSSASIQKLFCGICSAFKCSFDEFGGEKLVSPSYSSTILGPPPWQADSLPLSHQGCPFSQFLIFKLKFSMLERSILIFTLKHIQYVLI